MKPHAAPFRLTLAALATAALLAACGGGDASPPPETVPPSLTISDNVSTAAATGPVTFTFTFSEPVTGFTIEDIVVSGGTPGTFTMGATNTSATLVVTPGDNTTGNLQVSVAAGRYADAAGNANTTAASALQAFDTTGGAPVVTNLLANGNFESGATGWTGNALQVRTEGGNSFNFANVATAGQPYDVNLSYPLSIPTAGVQYRLTFKASSNRNRLLIAGIGLNQDPWTATTQEVTLTTTPQTFVVNLTSNFASASSRVIFDMGHDTGDVVIDDVVLETVEPPPPANLLANGNFESGVTGWTGNALQVRTEGGNSFNFANVATAGQPYDVNLSYPLSIPTAGVQYRLTFKASSNRNRLLIAGIGLNQDPWTATTQEVTLTTTPQTFVVNLTSNFASASSRVIFDMGHDTGDVVIDDVVLETVEDEPTPPTGGVLNFSSGFTSNVLTSSGGAIASAGGSNLDGYSGNCGDSNVCGSGTGGSGADSFMYFYYQTPNPATALYSQIELFGPGITGLSTTGDTGGVTISGQTKVNFTFNPNPEWFNSGSPRLGVVLTLGKRYSIGEGCHIQLHGVKPITSEGSIAYSMNLANEFRVAQDCGTGIAPDNVAAALAASPVVSSVKFLGAGGGAAIIGRNGSSTANLSVAAGAVYPTTVALKGGITFD